MSDTLPRWLTWARELQAMSQIGLHYCDNDFDRERYSRMASIAAEIIAEHTQLSVAELLAHFDLEPGYATVKVDVRGAVIQDGKLLLVQEASDRYWAMPGGWADVGDSPAAMVEREILEESGLEAQASKLIGVFDANRQDPLRFHHAYKLVFLCELLAGEPRPNHETLAVDFFAFDALPPLSMLRTHPRHLAEIHAQLDDPQRPCYFE